MPVEYLLSIESAVAASNITWDSPKASGKICCSEVIEPSIHSQSDPFFFLLSVHLFRHSVNCLSYHWSRSWFSQQFILISSLLYLWLDIQFIYIRFSFYIVLWISLTNNPKWKILHSIMFISLTFSLSLILK